MTPRALLVFLLLAPSAFGQGMLEVISLKHRTADEVIPVLRPLGSARVGPGIRTQSREENADQRIQVLEGGQAYLSSGESRAYADAASGFAVVPRISGTLVTLEILAQQERFARGGAIQGQRASSTVSGRLGEWLEIGGSARSASRSESGILSRREVQSGSERRLWVKVEEAGN